MYSRNKNLYLDIEEFILDLKVKGITVGFDDTREQLAISVNSGVDISKKTLNLLKKHKEKIIEYLQRTKEYLSFQQKSILLAEKFKPDDFSKYNMPLLLEVSQDLNVKLMVLAITTAISNHNGLNVNFIEENGLIYSKVHRFDKNSIEIVNIKNISLNKFLQENINTIFQLNYFPLYLIKIIKYDGKLYVLFVFHHIIIDGQSLGYLIEEIFENYKGYFFKEKTNLNEQKPGGFEDYIIEQKKRFFQGNIKPTIDEWKKELSNAAATNFPFATHKVDDNIKPEIVSVKLSSKTKNSIENFCQQESVSNFVFFTTIFYLLISKLTNQSEHVFMFPVVNRGYKFYKSIGMYTDIFPLRVNCEDDTEIMDLLSIIKNKLNVVLDRAWLPSRKVFNVGDSPNSKNIFSNIYINYFYDGFFNSKDNNVQFKQISIDEFVETSKYNLAFYISEGDDICIRSLFNASLYEREDIEYFLEQFLCLTEEFLKSPKKIVSEINLISRHHVRQSADPRKVLKITPNENIATLIIQSINEHREKIAIKVEHKEISYMDLGEKIKKWILLLRKYSVKENEAVAIISDRDIDFICLTIAVVTIGAVLVYLDDVNDDKLSLLNDNFSALYLIDMKKKPYELYIVNEDKNIIININKINGSISFEQAVSKINYNSPAYVFFTSGTTGKPKMILGRHSALVNFIQWQKKCFDIHENDNVAQVASITFDAILREIFVTLASAATLHICSEAYHYTNRFFQWLSQSKISIIHLVPSVIDELLHNDAIKINFTYSLRYIFFSGEPLRAKFIKILREKLAINNKYNIVNFYGCTEATMIQAYYKVPQNFTDNIAPVKNYVSNTQLIVLNNNYRQCDLNEIGQIIVRSPYLSLGYLGNVKLTQGKFIINPVTNMKDDLVYLTGDEGYVDIYGYLKILGRKDSQIKVMGVRIDLHAIEAIVESHVAIDRAIGLSMNIKSKQVVFLVLQCNSFLDVNTLVTFVHKNSDNNFIPNRFYLINSFPLNKNGKIDKLQLASLIDNNALKSLPEKISTMKLSENEKKVAKIWQEALTLDKQINPNDNFFALGGNSLSALMVVASIKEVFSISLQANVLFEHAKISELAVIIEQRLGHYSEFKKNDILQPVKEESQTYPISYQQFRMWMLDKIDPVKSHYHSNTILKMKGILDENKLHGTLRSLLQRHTILRTLYIKKDEDIIQEIIDINNLKIPYKFINLCDSEEMIELTIKEEINRPFNLSVVPSIRFCLLRLADNRHILVVTIHHVGYDAWSRKILLNDFSNFYNDEILLGREKTERVLQYHDYTMWQRKLEEKGGFEKELLFWRNYLKGYPLLKISNEKNKENNIYNGKLIPFTLTKNISKQIFSLAKSYETTVFSILLCAYYIYLSKYYNEEELVVGIHVGARPEKSWHIIGYFANMLPIRFYPSGNKNFKTLVIELHKKLSEIYKHQFLPYEILKKSVSVETDYTGNLFNTLFSFQDEFDKTLYLNDLKTDVSYAEYNLVSDFPLSLYMYAEEKVMKGWVQYQTTLFNDNVMLEMLTSYKALLANLIKTPEIFVDNVTLLSSMQRKKLLLNWNETDKEYPKDKCLHEIFAAQAVQTPETIAVIIDDNKLSYGELNHKANQFARFLRTRYQELYQTELLEDTLIGLCIERSLDMIIGILGILKSGAAYVPLDPEYPESRLDYMLTDSAAKLIITKVNFTKMLMGLSCISADHLVVVDEEKTAKSIESYTGEELGLAISSRSLAYVIYTSGSTGLPKGVMVEHSGIVNRLAWMRDYFQLSSTDVVLQKTPYSFDVSVWELLWPLLFGAKLVFALPGRHKEVSYLHNAIRYYGITIIHFVPSMLQSYVDYLSLAANLSPTPLLRCLICSGEGLSNQLAQCVQKSLSVNLYNLYGPTEASIDVSYYHYNSKKHTSCTYVPIGKPIDNTQLYILAKNLNPRSVGSIGELYIGGDGLARGYLNRTDLTQEKFVSNPFAAELSLPKEDKIYQTGDLVRWLADGNIEYIGRIDNQVKLRGFRIELNEIEAILSQHPLINQCVVIIYENDRQKFIVAYYQTIKIDNDIESHILNEYLAVKLPIYMVPSKFICLECIPLLPNGKIDRKELAQREIILETSDSIELATTDEQIKVSKIWVDVLNLDFTQISITASFFALGGDSISYAKMIFIVNSKFNVDFDLVDFINDITIKNIAECISIKSSSSQNHSDDNNEGTII